MAGIGQHYCLRWNNYQSNMTSVFYQLLRTEAFVDVTLTCNESSLKAHKVVLSACSSYFQKLLMDNPCKHPTIILPQEVGFSNLKFIIEFVYRGEIDVSQAELQSLLKTADQLKIKGLCEVPEDDEVEMDGNSISESVTDVSVLAGAVAGSNQLLQEKLPQPPHKHKLYTIKVKNKMSPDLKRKLSHAQETNGGAARKYFIKQSKNVLVEQQAVHLIQTATVLNSATGVGGTQQQQQQQQEFQNMQQANCITVATSTEDDDDSSSEKESKVDSAGIVPVVILENSQHQQLTIPSAVSSLSYIEDQQQQQQSSSPIMSSCTTLTTLQPQVPILLEQNLHHHHHHLRENTEDDNKSREVEIMSETQPPGPTATPVHCHSIDLQHHSPTHRDIAVDTSGIDIKVKFETLRTMDQTSDNMDTTIENHMSEHQSINDDDHTMQTMMITPELLGLIPSTSSAPPSEVGSSDGDGVGGGKNSFSSKKDWTQDDMEAALDALRNHNMSLTKASNTFGIPSTTLWQRAHRLGIDTPKKEGLSKTWNEDVLNVALDALRTGSLSANKASKAYGIPSSTLYKIARREGIRLATPFNAVPTTWSQEDLEKALEAIRTGQTTVQKAASEFGIPSGTLYGRCKREKIELSRSNPTPWSQDAMTEALEAIRLGQMSINQASIHYNLPYSSLYGRFRRGKYEPDHSEEEEEGEGEENMSDLDVQTNSATHSLVHQHATELSSELQSQSIQPSPPQQQPQIMLLQYQHTPTSHLQMYQSNTPS